MYILKTLFRILYVIALWIVLGEIKTTKGKIRLVVLVLSLCIYEFLAFKLA